MNLVLGVAGFAALPDGDSGPAAGQIATFGPGNTTRGKFEEISTEKKAGPKEKAVDITLPAGAEVITVWFRVSGAIPTGVGFERISSKTSRRNSLDPRLHVGL